MKLLAVVALVGACRGGTAKGHRAGSAAPVEIVSQPQLPDGGHGPGPTTDEIEPNDGDDVATPLALGGTVRGRIDPDTDVDHYRIDVDKPGALAVMVTGIEGVDLVLEIEDASGTVIARSDRGGARVKEGVPNLGVMPGRYTAVVHAAPKKKPAKKPKKPELEPPKGPSPVYEISAQLVAPGPNVEHEPDDDRGTANELLPSDTVTGYLGWTGDQDVWKLKAEALAANNVLAIDIAPVEGLVIELEIDDGIGQPLLVRKGARGDGVAVHNFQPAITAGAPPFQYLVVRADRSNPETPYQLHTAAAVPNPDSETEPDDTVDKPYAIAADRTVVHAWWDVGDADCFAIPVAAEPRTIEVAIDTPAEVDLAAELFVDGKPVAKVDHPGKGVATSIRGQVAGGGHAVVCVRGAGASPGRLGVAYEVHVQESAATGDNAP